MDRKGFLKLLGVTAAAGLTGKLDSAALAAGRPHAVRAGSSKRKRHWAMAVDLVRCAREKGCTKCIEACRAEHNVPEMPDKKHEIKWIWKEGFEHAFHGEGHEYLPEMMSHLPTPLMCNHCEEPACTKVCPTGATWKRESDGLVMMDWHRCIGCRFCMAACPYGSRSFNFRDPRPFIKHTRKEFPTRTKGVVEKCTFCEQRLEKGRQPACVEACPAKALVFGDLKVPGSRLEKLLRSRFSIVRKPALGTQPQVYYLVS